MAIYKDARVTWNAIVLNGVRVAGIELGHNTPDATEMGDEWATGEGGGIKTAAVELELKAASVAGTTTFTNFTLFGTTANFGLERALSISPTTGSPSITNPRYSGNFVLEGCTPVQGTVGDLQILNASLTMGSGNLTIATST